MLITHRRYSFRAGFTLIELMIVVTLMALLFGGGITSYRRLERRQSLLNICNQIKLLATTAQKRARVGDRPTGCTRLNSYRLRQTASSPYSIRLEAICTNATVTIPFDPASSDYTLSSRFTLSSFGTMTFQVLHGGLAESASTVTAETTDPNYRCTFTVDGGGSMTPVTVMTY